MVPETPGRLAAGLERPMNAQVRPVAVTVNLQGKTVELQQLGEDALFGRASYGKYAYAVGCERLFGLLDRHGIKATVFVPGAEAEANPDYVAALARRGHEIAAHGWAMEAMDAPGIDERALIERTHAALTRIVGASPHGFRAPHGKLTEQTLGHLAALGYRYDSSFQDDDRPYRLDADGGGGMIEVPQSEILIDATLYAQRQTHDRVMKTWHEEIEAMHRERCLITLTLHPRSDYGSARASRIAALDRLLTWLRGLPGVAFMRCDEIAAAADDFRSESRRG
jgi:peptidoglycan-N-acetylglucosamine deacetylase